MITASSYNNYSKILYTLNFVCEIRNFNTEAERMTLIKKDN